MIDAFIGFVLMFLLAMVVVTIINDNDVGTKPYSEIIEHGCGSYDDITGEFQWK